MMKRKQRLPETPPPADSEAVQAAWAIATAVNQGLPGDQFARIMNLMHAETVRTAANFSVEQVTEWFKEDPGARAILDRVPNFPGFIARFHAAAQQIYPPATLGAS